MCVCVCVCVYVFVLCASCSLFPHQGHPKGFGTRCNFLTSATSGLPQVAIQIAVLAAHVATLNRSPRNPIPNENSRRTIRDFSFASRLWVIGSYEMPRCDWLQHCNFLAGIEILLFALQTACKPCGFAAGRPAIVAGPVLRVAIGESCSVCWVLNGDSNVYETVSLHAGSCIMTSGLSVCRSLCAWVST